MMEEYNYIDVFTGIGGFSYAAYLAGMRFKNHFASEIDKYCVKLFQKRFPDSIQLGDITKINIKELIKKYGNKWILTGGFPCQDISIAGNQEGIYGERSGLWFEYWKLIRDLRPDFAVVENVLALTSNGLSEVLGSLSEIGYNAEWQIISAENVGAPHKRERIWILAYSRHLSGWDKKQGILRGVQTDRKISNKITGSSQMAYSINSTNSTNRGQSRKEKELQKKYRKKGCSRVSNRTGDEISNTESMSGRAEYGFGGFSGSEGKKRIRNIYKEISNTTGEWGGIQSSSEMERQIQRESSNKCSKSIRETSYPTGKGLEGKKSKRSRQGKSGLPAECDWWKTEPCMGMLVDGLPSGLDRFEGRLTNKSGTEINPQLKGLGNAIVPQIVRLLFEQIKPLL